MTSRVTPTSFASILIVASVLLSGVAAEARAQSDAQLRQENARLREELRELREEFAAQKRRIAELERENASLRKEIAEQATSTPTRRSRDIEPLPEPPVSIDESVANASPRALHAALVKSYRSTLGAYEVGENDSPERRAYMKRIERWREKVAREFRTRIEWNVEILDATRLHGSRDVLLRLVAVDPVHGTKLGAAFETMVSTSIMERIERSRTRGQVDGLVLTGVLSPEPRILPDVMTIDAPFVDYELIGPFAEFAFKVDVNTLLPETKDDGTSR